MEKAISNIKIITWNTEDYFKIIDILYRIVCPHEFIPMFYPEDKTIYFFKCNSAINVLKETIKGESYTYEKDKTFSLSFGSSASANVIKLIHSENIQSVLYYVIRTSLKKLNLLDLDNFSENKDLLKLYYFPLFYPPNISILLKVISTINFDSLKTLKLSNNKIGVIADFQIPIWAPNVTDLDLSNNNLSSVKDISTLRTLNLKALQLNGNPVIFGFARKTYAEVFSLLFPNLYKLDGKIFKPRTYVLISSQKFQYSVNPCAEKLVDDFMRIYFNLFDSDERLLLQEMYHPTAMFSLSCEYADNVAKFLKWKRNLLEDKKTDRNLFTGSNNITKCLQSLPKTQHDPFTFLVDVTIHNLQHTLIHISGVFKLPATNLAQDEMIFEFMRTFLLVNDNYRYKIANDMLSISSHVTCKSKKAFQKVAVKEPIHLNLKLYPSDESKKQLKLLLKSLCELSLEQCETFLNKAEWDFAKAIKEAMKHIQTHGFENSPVAKV